MNHNFNVLIGLMMLILTSCHTRGKQEVATKSENDVFLDSLVESQIDSSDYYISLPKDYRITKSEGPDFLVYYFSSPDTLKETFSGGFYFGNFPHKFAPANDSCKITSFSGEILGASNDWTMFDCDNDYSIQTIVNSRSDEDWNNFLHAFGNAKSKDGVRKLTTIYTTFREDKQL